MANGVVARTQHDKIEDDLFPLGAPDRTTSRPRSPAGRVDLLVTRTLFALCVPLIGAGWVGILMGKFAFDRCGNGGCNYAAGSATYIGFPIAAAISTLLLGIAAWRRRRNGRRGWALGTSAPLIIAALFFASTIIIQVASRPW